MRIALGLEYDGRAFCGWQTQPGGGSVQDALEAALARIADGPVSVVCAGRTDAGVHATGQVVHFDTDAVRPDTAWTRGVNSHLPPSMAVCWARRVDPAFHARFAAVARRYRYLLLPRDARPGLESGRVGWWHGPLDVGAMREAAAALQGEHDFTTFRAAECQAKSPVRTLHSIRIAAAGRLVCFDLRANAFLHHMVRNIVGALVYIGAGRQPPGWAADLLAARDRRLAAPTFAPDGLYLTAVEYPPDSGVPAPAPDSVMPLP